MKCRPHRGLDLALEWLIWLLRQPDTEEQKFSLKRTPPPARRTRPEQQRREEEVTEAAGGAACPITHRAPHHPPYGEVGFGIGALPEGGRWVGGSPMSRPASPGSWALPEANP